MCQLKTLFRATLADKLNREKIMKTIQADEFYIAVLIYA